MEINPSYEKYFCADDVIGESENDDAEYWLNIQNFENNDNPETFEKTQIFKYGKKKLTIIKQQFELAKQRLFEAKLLQLNTELDQIHNNEHDEIQSIILKLKAKLEVKNNQIINLLQIEKNNENLRFRASEKFIKDTYKDKTLALRQNLISDCVKRLCKLEDNFKLKIDISKQSKNRFSTNIQSDYDHEAEIQNLLDLINKYNQNSIIGNLVAHSNGNHNSVDSPFESFKIAQIPDINKKGSITPSEITSTSQCSVSTSKDDNAFSFSPLDITSQSHISSSSAPSTKAISAYQDLTHSHQSPVITLNRENLPETPQKFLSDSTFSINPKNVELTNVTPNVAHNPTKSPTNQSEHVLTAQTPIKSHTSTLTPNTCQEINKTLHTDFHIIETKVRENAQHPLKNTFIDLNPNQKNIDSYIDTSKLTQKDNFPSEPKIKSTQNKKSKREINQELTSSYKINIGNNRKSINVIPNPVNNSQFIQSNLESKANFSATNSSEDRINSRFNNKSTRVVYDFVDNYSDNKELILPIDKLNNYITSSPLILNSGSIPNTDVTKQGLIKKPLKTAPNTIKASPNKSFPILQPILISNKKSVSNTFLPPIASLDIPIKLTNNHTFPNTAPVSKSTNTMNPINTSQHRNSTSQKLVNKKSHNMNLNHNGKNNFNSSHYKNHLNGHNNTKNSYKDQNNYLQNKSIDNTSKYIKNYSTIISQNENPLTDSIKTSSPSNGTLNSSHGYSIHQNTVYNSHQNQINENKYINFDFYENPNLKQKIVNGVKRKLSGFTPNSIDYNYADSTQKNDVSSNNHVYNRESSYYSSRNTNDFNDDSYSSPMNYKAINLIKENKELTSVNAKRPEVGTNSVYRNFGQSMQTKKQVISSISNHSIIKKPT
ncbi:hypothetical protein BB561_004504 [Smittium simulii]|uniref:Uncharacterized protein n=1 Tax=Smittium simulii TaxID=133385 RepID=A0A2T9YFX8_9FUNG|nr:hypothetical protein BB561_004504 [Smittium simulii]